MKVPELAVAGIGMVTPVGHDTIQSCASIFTNISMFEVTEEFNVFDRREQTIEVSLANVSGVTDGHRRYRRLEAMAVRAFTEAVQSAGLTDEQMNDTALYLCLAEEGRPGLDDRAEKMIPKKLSQIAEIEELTSKLTLFNVGHAGAFYVVEAALHDLVQGTCKTAIIGAVDTYIDRVTLQWLSEMNWLKTEEHSDGFIPGEASAFAVIRLVDHNTSEDAKYPVVIGGVTTALENNHIYGEAASKGEGLIQCISATLQALSASGQSADTAICDLNGQRYRSLEWGLCIPRAFQHHSIPAETVVPATSVGNTGAASGMINLCYGVQALKEGYAQSNAILVWGSSDDGQRGSLYLRQKGL